MAQGKEIGAFTLKATSVTYTPGPGDALTAQVNVEGETTGEVGGTTRGTLVVVGEPGGGGGTYTYCGVTLQADGGLVAVSSQGSVEDIGNHKRRLRGINRSSDGRVASVEAEGDLMAQTLTGKIYE